mgnify:CR=1 FL=1
MLSYMRRIKGHFQNENFVRIFEKQCVSAVPAAITYILFTYRDNIAQNQVTFYS